MSLIIYAIPVFFLLIGLEALMVRMRGLPYYRFNDAITNLSCGIGSQVTGVFIKVLAIGAYAAIYEGSPWHGQISNSILTMIQLFIGVDFFYYWFHRLAHEISVLWGSHIVHHQSEEYNLTVALRQAWFQGVFSWVFYLPLAFLGFDTSMFVTIASIQTLYQFWIHTKMIDRMPSWFEYIFNTPSHHRVHHGVNPEYIDKNHGGTLIIFDRLFGTFQNEKAEVVYGITTQPHSWNPIWLNFQYWLQLLKDIIKAQKPADAMRMLTLEPGWKPKSLGGGIDYKEITAATFHKYDTKISATLSYYILFQFVILILVTSLFLFTEKYLSWPGKAAIASYVVLSVLNFGAMFEHRKWGFVSELIRFALWLGISSVAIWSLFYDQTGWCITSIAFVVIYGAVSVLWLFRCKNEMYN